MYICFSNSTCLYHKINDGECDLINFNEECHHDGGDCCPSVALIGDSFCNPENDIRACNYDGGDCCLTEQINDGFCDPVNYNRMCRFDGADCHCEYNLIGNSVCDLVNNKVMCDYDGGDCCDLSKVGDGLCYELNNNPKCFNDGGDCCEGDIFGWGSVPTDYCDKDLNNAACLYDKGGCCGRDNDGNGNDGDPHLMSDGVCQEYNNNPECQYDGGDCLECLNPNSIGDGHCNRENLNHQCHFDGWDCCANYQLINNGICDAENYNKACNFDGSDCLTLCPYPHLVGNAYCDDENNVALCNFDGGDCCRTFFYEIGYCSSRNNNRMCEYDSGDCCGRDKNGNDGNVDAINDGICQDENNNGQCRFDGGDCCLAQVNTSSCSECECITQEVIQPFDPCPSFAKIGDGICHDENNNLICSYDGGDCCEEDIDTSNCTSCQKCLKFKEMNVSPYEGFCPLYAKIGDGICQDENNVDLCLYDSGDCCLAEVNTTQCTECRCISDKDEFDPCPLGSKIADGSCDLSNNNTICSFDGGDCSQLSI